MASAVLFHNYSSQDFSHTWDKESYAFPAHQSMMLPSYLADHFAYHLAVRELYKRLGNSALVNANMIEEEKKKCFQGVETVASSQTKLEVQMMNETQVEEAKVEEAQPVVEPVKVKAPFCDTCDSKGIRHKKECPKIAPKVEAVV